MSWLEVGRLDERLKGKAVSTGESRVPVIRDRAARFKANYPWIDEQAVRIVLGLMEAEGAHRDARARFFEARHFSEAYPRFSTLRALLFAESKRLAQYELATELKVSPSNVTYLIDGMEKDGLVVRTAGDVDRRVTCVELTPAGEEMAKRIVPAMPAFMADLLVGFTADEKVIFCSLLERLVDNANKWTPDAGTEMSGKAPQPETT